MDYEELLAFIEKKRSKIKKIDKIHLIAVSKNQPVEKIFDIYHKGCRDFGESRVQEWQNKKKELPLDIVWHFIGPLQKNKVRKVVDGRTLIHSVDSIELAEKIDSVSHELGVITNILLEVNISREKTKHGFLEEELLEALERIILLRHITIEGLMTIGPHTSNKEEIRTAFRSLKHIQELLTQQGYPLKHLSMGMSSDFDIAIEEGATLLRVGSLLFGERG